MDMWKRSCGTSRDSEGKNAGSSTGKGYVGMEKVFSVQDREDAFEYVLSAARECGRIIALVQVGS